MVVLGNSAEETVALLQRLLEFWCASMGTSDAGINALRRSGLLRVRGLLKGWISIGTPRQLPRWIVSFFLCISWYCLNYLSFPDHLQLHRDDVLLARGSIKKAIISPVNFLYTGFSRGFKSIYLKVVVVSEYFFTKCDWIKLKKGRYKGNHFQKGPYKQNADFKPINDRLMYLCGENCTRNVF